MGQLSWAARDKASLSKLLWAIQWINTIYQENSIKDSRVSFCGLLCDQIEHYYNNKLILRLYLDIAIGLAFMGNRKIYCFFLNK